MTAQGISTVAMDGGRFDFICAEVLYLSSGETRDAYMVDSETVSTDGSGGRLFIGKIVAWRPRLVTEDELAIARAALPALQTFRGTLPLGLGHLLVLAPRLLQEVERHRTNLAALEENPKRWPATMTRDRMLSDLHAARTGYHLEMLT